MDDLLCLADEIVRSSVARCLIYLHFGPQVLCVCSHVTKIEQWKVRKLALLEMYVQYLPVGE